LNVVKDFLWKIKKDKKRKYPFEDGQVTKKSKTYKKNNDEIELKDLNIFKWCNTI